MAEKMSYLVSEREYEAVSVLRDVIVLVTEEVESKMQHDSVVLSTLRDCATEVMMEAATALTSG